MMTTDATNATRKASARELNAYNEAYFEKLPYALLGGRESGMYSIVNGSVGDFSSSNTQLVAKLFRGYDANVPEMQSTDGSSVHVLFGGSNTYQAVGQTSWSTEFAEDAFSSKLFVDINVYQIAGAPARKTLDSLYAWYDLLRDDKWLQFAAGQKVSVATADKASKTTKTVSLTDMEPLKVVLSETGIKELAESKFAPFALRQLVQLYIRILSFYVVLHRLSSTQAGDYISLAHGIYYALHYHIDNMTVGADSPAQRMTGAVTRRVGYYNSTLQHINGLSSEYTDARKQLQDTAARMAAERQNTRAASIISATSLSVLAATCVVSIVAHTAPMESQSRLIVASASVALAAVAALALTVAFSRSVTEGFASARDFALTKGSTYASDASYADRISDYSNAFLELANKYITSVRDINQNMQAYQLFNNATGALVKESRYFDESKQQLDLATRNHRAMHRISDLSQKQAAATTYYCVTMALVVSTTLLAILAVPQSSTAIVAAASVVTVAATTLYLLQRSSYVRTDGDKMYWGAPPAISG